MIELLSQSELCSQIISIKRKDMNEFAQFPENIKSLVPNGVFPIVSSSDIRSITKEMQKGGDIAQVLRKYSFSFPFSEESIIYLISNPSYLQDKSDYSILIILHSYLAWYTRFVIEHNVESISTIFNALNSILQINPTKTIPKSKSLIASAFQNLYSEVIDDSYLQDVTVLFTPLVQYLTMNENLPQEAFNILLKTANRVIDKSSNSFTKETNQFANFFVMIIRSCGPNYPKFITTNIVLLMRQALIGLCDNALSFFGRSLPTLGIDEALDIIVEFPQAIINYITQSDPIFPYKPPPNTVNIVTLPPNDTCNIQYSLMKDSTFAEDIDLSLHSELPSLIDPKELINPNLIGKFDLIKKISDNENQLAELLLTKLFSHLLSPPDNPYLWDIYSAFLYFINILTKEPTAVFPPHIFQSPLFDNSVTFYDQLTCFTKVSSIRKMAIDVLLHQEPAIITSVFSTLKTYPKMFSEFILRFTPNQSNTSQIKECVEILSTNLMSSMIYFQGFTKAEQSKIKVINEARCSILLCLKSIFQVPELQNEFFTSQLFINRYISLIFEKPIRCFVLRTFFDYFMTESGKSNERLYTKLICIFQNCFKDDYSEQAICLSVDIIKFLNEIARSCEMAKIFEPILSHVCKWATGIKDYDLSFVVIKETVTLFISFIDVHAITQPEISVIETIAHKMYGNSPTDEFLIILVSLIAGHMMENLNPDFLIKQPKALRLLISLYQESDQILPRVQFIISLCLFSITNCDQCHKGEFDLFLVKSIYQWRNDFLITDELMEKSLYLLKLIASKSSSVSVVQQFVTLLCPYDGRSLSRFQPMVLDTLSCLIQDARNIPSTPIALVKESAIHIGGVTTDLLRNDCSIFFWLFLGTPISKKPVTLLAISDESGRRMTIKMEKTKLFIYFEQQNKNSYYGVNYEFPVNIWCLATFVMTHENNKLKYKITINGVQLETISFEDFYFDGIMKMRIGGSSINGNPILLGSVAFLSMIDSSDTMQYYEQGPRAICGDPLLYINAYEHNNVLRINKITKYPQVTVKIDTSKTLHTPSFTDILIDRCNVDILLPLFAQIDLNVLNDLPFENLLERVIDIFESALSLSVNAQSTFSCNKGFNIISHLLLSAKENHITFQLYWRFCLFFETLDDDECRRQLMKSILLNAELWMRATAIDHQYILQHWSRSLVPANIEMTSEIISFVSILSIMRVNYWYEPVEIGNIKWIHRVRDQKLDVKECRKSLFIILHLLARYRLTSIDFSTLVSHILTLTEAKQVYELLAFVKDLVYEKKLLKMDNSSIMDSIIYLCYMSHAKDIDIIWPIFDLIFIAHREGLISSISRNEHFQLILHQIPNDFTNQEILNKLVENMEEFPEILTLCMMVAYSLGEESLCDLISHIRPTCKFYQNEFWPIWIVIALYKQTIQVQDDILQFLSKTPSSQWITIYNCIDVIGRIFYYEPNDMIRRFINFLVLHIKEDKKIENYIVFYSICRFFLFFKSNKSENAYLASVISNSPFGVKEKNLKLKPVLPRKKRTNLVNMPFIQGQQNPKTNKCPSMFLTRRSSAHIELIPLSNSQSKFNNIGAMELTASQLTEKVKTYYNENKLSFYFGIKVNQNNDWEDEGVAQLVVDCFLEMPSKDFLDMILLIGAFSHSINIQKCISIYKYEELPPVSAVAVYNNHAIMKKKSQLCTMSPQEISINSNLFLEAFEREHIEKYKNPSVFLRTLAAFQTRMEEKAAAIKEHFTAEYGPLSIERLSDYKESVSLSQSSSAKLWSHFWHSMTIDRAPWNLSLPDQHRSAVHFKRDFTYCADFCPMKMRRNFSFSDHMQESFARDTGSSMSAQSLYEMYKTDISRKYSMFEPAPIFEVIEEPEDNSESVIYAVTKVLVEVACEIITISHTQEALFCLQQDVVLLTKTENGIETNSTKVIQMCDITMIFLRTYLHRDTAIEIFDIDGNSYFINFPTIKAMLILNEFSKIKNKPFKLLQNSGFKQFFQSTHITQKWYAGEISNFSYLMLLNVFSGRTFNCAPQYPIMPWVIADYSSDLIDLEDPNTFRNLALPIGAISPDRLEVLKESYMNDDDPDMKPFLYSSGFIGPLSLYLWLVRVEPFTTLHIEIQSGRFDAAARLFASIETAYKSVTTAMNDYRELIPEFFYSPEFLLNKNKFDLGRVDDKIINDVTLPKWAKTPMDFIYMNRKALESNYVSEHLHEWIDLVWGDKQTGPKAIEANNLYKAEMYSDIWDTPRGEDPMNRPEIETILGYVGQVPQQLFEKPHPQKIFLVKECSINEPCSYKLHQETILCGRISQIDSKTIKLLAIDSIGTCLKVTVDLPQIKGYHRHGAQRRRSFLRHGDDSPASNSNDEKLPCTILTKTITEFEKIHRGKSKNTIYTTLAGDTFGIVGKSKGEIYKVDIASGSSEMIINKKNDVIAVDSDGIWFAAADKDAVITLFSLRDLSEPQFTIPSFRDSINCCVLSQEFHSLVCGTRDCSLMICSLNGRSIIKVVNLKKCRPMNILITPAWGFIAVSLKEVIQGQLNHYIALFTINGDKIRKVPIDHPVTKWISWKSTHGFDYVLMADDTNSLYLFEAYYVNTHTKIIEFSSRIISLGVIPSDSIAVVLTEDSKIHFIPIHYE